MNGTADTENGIGYESRGIHGNLDDIHHHHYSGGMTTTTHAQTMPDTSTDQSADQSAIMIIPRTYTDVLTMARINRRASESLVDWTIRQMDYQLTCEDELEYARR
jgi:hypothetical protein